MSDAFVDVGSLNERLEVLELQETEPGVWSWQVVKKLWSDITLSQKTNLFSSVGIGARGAELIVRHPSPDLHHALRRTGSQPQHLFLTAIVPYNRMYDKVTSALVTPAKCSASRIDSGVGVAGRPQIVETMHVTFPAILTERYWKQLDQKETHAEYAVRYVLVTPKPIVLQDGDLVEVHDGDAVGVYYVTACHMLDAYKNEYEIDKKGDV